MDAITSEWLEPLNAILPKIMTLEKALEIEALKGNDIPKESLLFDALLLQKFVFQTVDFAYKSWLIDAGHLKRFLETKDTVQFASINLDQSKKIFSFKDYQNAWGFSRNHYSQRFVELVDQGKGQSS
jgi:hypothetical protein